MLNKLIFFSLVALVLWIDSAWADTLEFTAQCTTRGTATDGRRVSCTTHPKLKHTVPTGYILDQNSLRKRFTSENGSSNKCHHWWADWVEILPGTGVSAPTTIIMAAYARSPSGPSSGRGWTHCAYTVIRAKLPDLAILTEEAQEFKTKDVMPTRTSKDNDSIELKE